MFVIYIKIILKKEVIKIPFKSEAQRRWAMTKEGTKALGGKQAVAEWEKATGNKKLPKYASKKKGK